MGDYVHQHLPTGHASRCAIRKGKLNSFRQLLAIKGQSAAAELEAAGPVLSALGVRSAEVLQAGHGRVVSATTIVRVVMGGHGREERAGAQRSRRGVA